MDVMSQATEVGTFNIGEVKVMIVVFTHEEDFGWHATVVPVDMLVGTATMFLLSRLVDAVVWPKQKEARLVKYATGELLDPEARLGDVVKPFEPLLIVWWPPRDEWWRKKDDDMFRLYRETEELRKVKAPRSPINLFREDFERLSIIRRLEREGKI